MRVRRALLLMASWSLAAHGADRYKVTLRLPPGGLFAREEMQIEFRIEDTSRPDPLGGFAPLVRASPVAIIDMPQMPGMPKFSETAHAEGMPGDYGVHPTFAHGGEYRLVVRFAPPSGELVESLFPLSVSDAKPKTGPLRYSLEVMMRPKRPRAGEPVEIDLVVRDGNAVVDAFDLMHEKLMHLVIVRKDLGRFAHEHPERSTGGAFGLRYTFPAGGEYRLFADVAPRGASNQILTARLKVAGPEGASFDIRRERPSIEGLLTRKTIRVSLPAPGDTEPYLGARAHLMMVHEDGESFVHSHPVEDSAAPAGTLEFLARFPKAGLYRGWLQYMRGGQVQTTELVLRAEDGR